MLTVIAQFSVKADKINDFLIQCQELIKHTRQETGQWCKPFKKLANNDRTWTNIF